MRRQYLLTFDKSDTGNENVWNSAVDRRYICGNYFTNFPSCKDSAQLELVTWRHPPVFTWNGTSPLVLNTCWSPERADVPSRPSSRRNSRPSRFNCTLFSLGTTRWTGPSETMREFPVSLTSWTFVPPFPSFACREPSKQASDNR